MAKRANVARSDELPWGEHAHGERFGHRRKQLGAAAGGERLGCSLYEVEPGKTAWPYHYHLGNEEAIFVLAGSGTLRLGVEEVAVSAGDYVALPANESGGHQVINTSDAPLRYLALSTMDQPDVLVYGDSGKLGVFAGSAPGGPKERRVLSKYFKAEDEVGYYEGE
jgi:uncharacterized cupin superfamily protein